MHDVGRHCSCDNVDEGETVSHRERLYFPTHKPISKLVSDEVIRSLISSISENWSAKAFPKIGGGDSKFIFYQPNVTGRSAR